MTIHARLPILLIAIALGAAEPSPPTPPAGQETSQAVTALAEAQRLQAARDPRAAIPLYTHVIERDPTDINVSAPALSGLIACHQMLVGDAQQAESYSATVGRWLDKLPPLDGKTVPAPMALREELLWAPVRSLRWRVGGISTGSRTETNETTTIRKTIRGISLSAEAASKPSHGAILRRLTCCVPDSKLVVSVGAQRIDTPVTSLGRSGDFILHLDWEDQPGVKRLDRIEGVIRLQQPLEVKDKEFALVKGTELDFVDGKATLSDVERDGDKLEVVVEWKRKKPRFGLSGVSSDPNQAVTILLRTAAGEMLTPVGQGTGGGGGDGIMRYHRNLRFRCDDKVVGVVRTVTAWSTRDVPILVEDIDLTKQAQP